MQQQLQDKIIELSILVAKVQVLCFDTLESYLSYQLEHFQDNISETLLQEHNRSSLRMDLVTELLRQIQEELKEFESDDLKEEQIVRKGKESVVEMPEIENLQNLIVQLVRSITDYENLRKIFTVVKNL